MVDRYTLPPIMRVPQSTASFTQSSNTDCVQ